MCHPVKFYGLLRQDTVLIVGTNNTSHRDGRKWSQKGAHAYSPPQEIIKIRARGFRNQKRSENAMYFYLGGSDL